jgi:serine/threonine protein kinase
LVESPMWWQNKKFLIIKSLFKQDDESRANINKRILNEYQLYLQSHHVFSKSENSIIQVPKTYWVFNDHEWYMMLMMDYISWMTLFAFKVSLILPILYRKLQQDIWTQRTIELLWSDKEYKNLTTDKEIKNALLVILRAFRHHNAWDFYQEHLYFFEKYDQWKAYNWTYAESQMANIYDSLSSEHALWMFSEKTLTYIQDALFDGVQKLHDNDIYHNDMNQRNLILWTDGKIYIIDFDKSSTMLQKPPISKLSGLLWDPKYWPKYKWKSIEGDFKIIKCFDRFIKK